MAAIATLAEAIFGVCLITGFQTRRVARGAFAWSIDNFLKSRK